MFLKSARDEAGYERRHQYTSMDELNRELLYLTYPSLSLCPGCMLHKGGEDMYLIGPKSSPLIVINLADSRMYGTN